MQHSDNKKILRDIAAYKFKIESKHDFNYYYHLKMDVIFSDNIEEDDPTIEYFVNRTHRERNIKSLSLASDEELTIEKINMSHFYGAVIWDKYTHDKDYTVNLLAIVIKKIETIEKVEFDKMKCKANEPLDMKMLDSKIERPKINNNNGLCALQHILDSIINIECFKKYSMAQIRKEFLNLGCDAADGVSVEDIQMWMANYGRSYLSFIAMDALGNCRYQSVAADSRFCIQFMVADKHIYGINNESIRQAVINTKSNKQKISPMNFRDNILNEYIYIDFINVFNNFDFGIYNPEFSLEYFNNNVKNFETTNILKFNRKYFNKKIKVIDDKLIVEDKYEKINIQYVAYKYSLVINGKFDKRYSFLMNEKIFKNRAIYFNMKNVTLENKTIINPFKIVVRKDVQRFEHPISECIFEKSNDTLELKQELSDKLYKNFGLSAYKFGNKSIGVLTEMLFKQKFGYLQKSNHTENDRLIIDAFYPRVFNKCFKEVNYNFETDIAIDIKKCFTNILLNRTEPYLI
ncbi:MAG: hypothetical protein ACXVHS_11375, partial [Methanobacterium sp.]